MAGNSVKAMTREEWVRLVNSYVYHKKAPGGEKYWDPKIETAPRAKIREIQSEKLKALVRYLWTNSRFYKRKFKEAGLEPGDVKGLEDLRKLPITTKEEWSQNQLEHPPFGDYHCITQEQWSKDGWMVYSTGGTTAKPRLFTFTLHDKEFWEYTWARALWSYGIRPGDVIFNTSVYGPYPGMWGVHYGAHLLRCPIIPGGGMDTRRRLFFIQEAQATVLVGVPSYLIHMGHAARGYGIDPVKDTNIRHLIVMAEPGACIPSTKTRLEEAWGAALHDLFGHTECFPCGLGWSCAEEDRHLDRPVRDHVSEDLAIIEVVNPETLEPLPPGQRGITIVTNLWSDSIPALRYLMGDLMVWNEEPCLCGRSFRQADGGLMGRLDHILRVKGVMVVPTAVEELVKRFPELGDEFRIIASSGPKGEELKIEVEPLPDLHESRWPELQNKVADEFQLVLGIKTNIELLKYETLPRFTAGDLHAKAKRVVDLRKEVLST